MKVTHGGSFQDGLSLEDVRTSFEALWRELDELEANFESADRKVRLDCNGDLVDIGSVGLAGLRESALGGELIEFVCPRCDELHESPSLR